MNKLSSQKVIFSQTMDHTTTQDQTYLNAYNRYKDELSNKSEALKRIRVLTRQLQKSRSDLRNKRRLDDQKQYVQEMADLDRFVLKLNSIEQ